jgi:hypothetical protein
MTKRQGFLKILQGWRENEFILQRAAEKGSGTNAGR